jgi:hypothetical protein
MARKLGKEVVEVVEVHGVPNVLVIDQDER